MIESSRPKVAAMYCVYNDDDWLEVSVKCVYEQLDKLFFFVSGQPWNGDYYEEPGKTVQSINKIPDPAGKIHIVEGSWSDQVKQRNEALAFIELMHFDYAFIIDSDEIYHPEHLSNLLLHVAENPEVECWYIFSVVFWKTHRFRIDPPDDYRPPMLLKVGCGGFVEYRNPRCEVHRLIPMEKAFCFHMSFARTNEQILRKIHSCSFAPLVREGWYENKWLAWDHDHNLEDLHPYQPGQFQRTIEVPEHALPEALLEYAKSCGR